MVQKVLVHSTFEENQESDLLLCLMEAVNKEDLDQELSQHLWLLVSVRPVKLPSNKCKMMQNISKNCIKRF